MSYAHLPATDSKQPIHCLVVQLARLGDTLQSLMALRAAKQLYPQLEIHFLARERFSCAAKKIPWITQVISFPSKELLVPIIERKINREEALKNLTQWVIPLTKKPWDLIINWTYSESSSYLTRLLPARIRLGYTRHLDLSLIGADGWSQFIQGIVQGNVHQNIHLTDILTTQLLTALQIHAGDPQNEGNSVVTSKSFFTLSIDEDGLNLLKNHAKKWISIQLGASQKSKKWDSIKWAQFISFILSNHLDYGVVLLGSKEDIPCVDEIQNYLYPLGQDCKRLVSLVDKTDFDHWATIIAQSQWLLAGDTAAIHLASVLGTPVINLSIGPVRYHETGPYGNIHYVVKTKDTLQLNENFSAEALYGLWSYVSSDRLHQKQVSLEYYFHNLEWKNHLEKIQVYRTKIRNPTDGGGVVFEPMIKRPFSVEEWTAMVMGQIARSWYCGWTPPTGQELIQENIHPKLIRTLRELQESMDVLKKICDQASQIGLLLSRKGSSLKSNVLMNLKDREEIQELGQTLVELEDLVTRLGKNQPPLLAFSQMSQIFMHHLKGNDLKTLGSETSQRYQQLKEGVEIFREWITFTLNMAKPRTVKPEIQPNLKEESSGVLSPI